MKSVLLVAISEAVTKPGTRGGPHVMALPLISSWGCVGGFRFCTSILVSVEWGHGGNCFRGSNEIIRVPGRLACHKSICDDERHWSLGPYLTSCFSVPTR